MVAKLHSLCLACGNQFADAETISGFAGDPEVLIMLHVIAYKNLQLAHDHLSNVKFLFRQGKPHEGQLCAGIDLAGARRAGLRHHQFQRLRDQMLPANIHFHGGNGELASLLRRDGERDCDAHAHLVAAAEIVHGAIKAVTGIDDLQSRDAGRVYVLRLCPFKSKRQRRVFAERDAVAVQRRRKAGRAGANGLHQAQDDDEKPHPRRPINSPGFPAETFATH